MSGVLEGMSNCLYDADSLTSETRRELYGHPLDNFTVTAEILSTLINKRYNVNITMTPDFVGLLMIGVKLAREANKSLPDNIIDIAGYARCIELVYLKQQENKDV